MAGRDLRDPPAGGLVFQDGALEVSGTSRTSPKHGGKAKTMPTHVFLPNGLVEVNPSGQHPIYDLLEKGREVWDGKLKRASRTLGEAVNEYRRRYGRAPPLGFDRW